MRIPSRKYTITGSTAGNLDGATAGTVTPAATVLMQKVTPGTLSAVYVVDAETEDITVAAQWQGSDDGSTWVDIAHAPQNPAAVVLATGTGGADAAVTRAVPAPSAVYGFRYARAAVVNGAKTGAAVDTYDISYRYLAT